MSSQKFLVNLPKRRILVGNSLEPIWWMFWSHENQPIFINA
jgi:hypothetical protein